MKLHALLVSVASAAESKNFVNDQFDAQPDASSIGIPFTSGYAHEKAPNHPYENALHDPLQKQRVEKVATMSLKRGSHSWPSLQKLRHNVEHPKRKIANHLKRMSLFSKQDPGYESYDSEPSGYDSDPSSEGYDDPSDPSDPSNPYEDPSDPSGYDDPSDPSNPYEDPSEPSGYDDPSEPSGYDDPSDPSNPYEDPSDPSNPYEDPSDPSQGPYDSDPSEPSGYEDPSEPSNPYEDPSEPSGYEDPSESSGYEGYEGGNQNFVENTDAGKVNRLAATHTMGSIEETGEVHQHFSRNHLLGDDDDTEPGEAAMDTDGMMGEEADDDLPDGVAQKFIKKTIQVQPGVYMSVEPYYVKPQEMSNELFDSNLELVSMPADVVMNLFIYQKGALNNGQMWYNGPLSIRRASYTNDDNKRNTISTSDISNWLCKWTDIGNFADGFDTKGKKCNVPNSDDSFGIQCVERRYNCAGFFTQYGNMHPRPALTLCSEYSSCGDETFTIGSGKVDPNCLDAVFGYTCKFGDFIQNKFYAKPFDKFNVNSIRNSFEQWMKYSFKPFDAAQFPDGSVRMAARSAWFLGQSPDAVSVSSCGELSKSKDHMAAFAKSLDADSRKRLMDLRAWCSRSQSEDGHAVLNVAVQFESEGADTDFTTSLQNTTTFGDAGVLRFSKTSEETVNNAGLIVAEREIDHSTEQNAEVETPKPSDLQMSLRRTAEAVVEHGKEFVQSIHDVISELPLVSTFATAF